MSDQTWILQPEWIIPVIPRDTVLQGHAIAITGDRIAAIGPEAEIRQQFPDAPVHMAEGKALLPGMVNTHTHSPMALLRGVGDDMPLMEWLEQRIWPVEMALLSPEFVRDGTTLAIAEMLRCGTTCFNESYFFPDDIAATAARLGMRGTVGLPVIAFPTPWAADYDEYFNKGIAVHDQYREHPLIQTAWAPHAPYTVNDEGLKRIQTYADQLDMRIHIHLHETAQEAIDGKAEHGIRPYARLEKFGLIHEHLIAVHMTALTDAEIASCAKHGVHVVHCPESNLKLASGFCPVESLQQAGVNVALGTDGAASNNDLSMPGEMRTAALLAKAVAQKADAVPAMRALEMATINGAKALGLDAEVGSLQIGKQADMALWDLDSLETQPCYSLISHLVYAAARTQITDVWVAGKALLKERELTTIDEQKLRQTVRKRQQQVEQVLAQS